MTVFSWLRTTRVTEYYCRNYAARVQNLSDDCSKRVAVVLSVYRTSNKITAALPKVMRDTSRSLVWRGLMC